MKCSAVLLNWKRPQNVERIVTGLNASDLVDEIIVFDNNPACELPPLVDCTLIQADRDLGLYTRFTAGCLARNEAVLWQDDDLLLPPETLRGLLDAWSTEPDILHGIFGRAPKPDGSYARTLTGPSEAPVVLTRVLVGHRRYCAEFFRYAGHFAEIQRDSRPFGNGEDIIFSYVVRRSAGRLHRLHRLPVCELPAPHAIHGRERNHYTHRNRLLRACEAWLKENDS
ncbi:MAG: hypothetical protein HQ567_06755 [Candidatus Nealsonbacteria bacterium]|nr:hypothetical protein [Candidatus Nealsonbacteria bacterium]